MFTCVLILLTFTQGNRAKDVITPYSDAAFATETETVKLSCNYTGSVDSLHWYRQYAGSPQFLILDYSGYVTHANPPVSGISISHRKEDNSVDLIISSAAVSDSALYYCALQPTVTGNTQHTIQEPETLLTKTPKVG
uniref:Ig-like domain-containing protein n=1 Tax=Sinocyclocheilus anshuiensis TaxID=1608454 RepID=A0A671Q1W5_9TELE